MSRLHPWSSGCSLLPVGNKWSPRRRNVRTNRLCGKHSSTPDPWVPLTVLLCEATGTLQMEKEDHPGLSGRPHLIAGTLTAEGATGGKGDVTLKMNRAHGKQKECGWPLRGELSRGRRASEETWASVPQLQGIISDNTQMSLEASSSSEHPGRNRNPLSPWFCSCKTLAEKQVQPRCTQTADLQNCDGINEHCFKLLNVY